MTDRIFTIYTKKNVREGALARDLLEQEGLPYREIFVADDDDCTLEDLEERTGVKSYPQIFFANQPIGSYESLKQLADGDGLKSLM
jgi:glutaredoxin